MALRRFKRLTNAYSKKLDNLKYACALYFAYYNFATSTRASGVRLVSKLASRIIYGRCGNYSQPTTSSAYSKGGPQTLAAHRATIQRRAQFLYKIRQFVPVQFLTGLFCKDSPIWGFYIWGHSGTPFPKQLNNRLEQRGPSEQKCSPPKILTTQV